MKKCKLKLLKTFMLFAFAFVLFSNVSYADEIVIENDKYDSGTYLGAGLSADQKTAFFAANGVNQFDTQKVDLLIWTDNTPMRAYATINQGNGQYVGFLNIADFAQTGNYYGIGIVTRNDGTTYQTNIASFFVEKPVVRSVKMTNVNPITGDFDIVASGFDSKSGVKATTVLVSSDNNPNDVKFYSAGYFLDGTFRAHVNVRDFNYNYGGYAFGVVSTGYNGTTSDAIFARASISMPAFSASAFKVDGLTYILEAGNIPCINDVSAVTFAVRNVQNGQFYAFAGSKQNDGRYMAFISTASGYSQGDYEGVAVVNYKNGASKQVGGIRYSIYNASINGIGVIESNSYNGTMTVALSGVNGLGGVLDVKITAWTRADFGDVYVYNTINCGGGNYLAQIKAVNHQCNYGTYGIVVDVVNGFGTKTTCSSTCVNLTPPNTRLEVILSDDQSNCSMTVLDTKCNADVTFVRFYVWNQGESDMRAYDTTKEFFAARNYIMPLADFGKMGMYYVLPEIHYNNGFVLQLSLGSFNVTQLNLMYNIAGTSGTNVEQLMRYFEANASYPVFYAICGCDAPTLRDFCQIYIEECAAENIRAEVAFCQAMKETGFLRFGGAVDIAAFNFAGIGAVDTSPGAYNWFSCVREGVRAQVQHLKAYANSDPLVYPQVDPRFHLVTRGTSPYVEWLGIKENPYGKGWATAAGYGYSIRDDYMAKLFMY